MSARIGSLFSGYGGLDLAVERVTGASTAWHSEIESAPSVVLAARFPGVPNLGDVTAVDWAAVEPVDVICGGSPCQDVSSAGKRAGMRAGTRSGLWASMCDAIDIIRPSLVVWENVRGVTSAEADSSVEPCPGCVGDGPGAHLRALGRVLGDLADIGYNARWFGLRAADVGAPHGRFRVFVAAHPRGQAFGLRAGLCESEQGRFRGRRPYDDVGETAHADQQGSQGSQPAAGLVLADRGAAPDAERGGWDGRTPIQVRGPGDGTTATGTSADVATDTDRSSSETRLGRQGTGDVGRLEPMVDRHTDWGTYEPAIRRWERSTGRPAPAPTERNTKGGQRLSPRFVEWMMGLPVGWVTDVPGISRNDQLKMLGNGVVPQQAAAALDALLAVSV